MAGAFVGGALSRARARGREIDFSDAATVRKIRALALSTLAVVGAANLTVLGLLYPALIDLGRAGTWLGLGSMLLIGAVAARFRAHCGEWAFLLLNLALQVPIAVFVHQMAVRSDGAVPEIALIDCCILPALFCARLRHALIGLTATTLTAAALAADRMQGNDYAGLAINAIVFIVLFVFSVVRLLRHLALGALDRAQRNEVTDPLTGLVNRRGVERFAVRRWADPATRPKSTALLVVDIDHFKQINDTWGHATGDEVIRKLGALLANSVRDDDLAARIGGEEFLLAIKASPGQAPSIAERLRARIEADLAPVTASIGGCEMTPGPDDEFPGTLWQAVDLADQSLYEAKRTGRNRAVVSPGTSTPLPKVPRPAQPVEDADRAAT